MKFYALDETATNRFESTFEFLMARYLLLAQTVIYAVHYALVFYKSYVNSLTPEETPSAKIRKAETAA